MVDRRPPKGPDDWLRWWPVIARALGVAGGFGQFLYSAASGHKPDPAWLSWCAGLTLAPNVFGRPGRRDDDDKPET